MLFKCSKHLNAKLYFHNQSTLTQQSRNNDFTTQKMGLFEEYLIILLHSSRFIYLRKQTLKKHPFPHIAIMQLQMFLYRNYEEMQHQMVAAKIAQELLSTFLEHEECVCSCVDLCPFFYCRRSLMDKTHVGLKPFTRPILFWTARHWLEEALLFCL